MVSRWQLFCQILYTYLCEQNNYCYHEQTKEKINKFCYKKCRFVVHFCTNISNETEEIAGLELGIFCLLGIVPFRVVENKLNNNMKVINYGAKIAKQYKAWFLAVGPVLHETV